MAQRVKTLVTNAETLNSIPMTNLVEGKNAQGCPRIYTNSSPPKQTNKCKQNMLPLASLGLIYYNSTLDALTHFLLNINGHA